MLNRRRTLDAIALGVFFWAVAALFIRFFGGPIFVHGSPGLIVLFALTVPLSWALVEVPPRMGRFSDAERVPAVVVMSLTALVLDGLAMTWAPGLYAIARPALVLPAAWLLFGVGVLLAFALTKGARRSKGAA